MRFSKKYESLIFCLIISVGIISLRLIASYPSEITNFTSHLVETVNSTIDVLGLSKLLNFMQNIPVWAAIIINGFANIFIGIVFLLIFKKSVKQGSMVILNSIGSVIFYGLIIYLLGLSVVLIFAYSVIGIPISAFMVFSSGIVVYIGNISVAVYVGYIIQEKLSIKGGTVIYYLFGSFVMIICKSVYAFGAAFIFFIFPVLAIGTVFVTFINKYFLNISYKIEYDNDKKNKKFDRKKIRDIITKGLD